MYLKQEIKNNLFKEKHKRKIGPDAIRFKHIKDMDEQSHIIKVEGTICNVGLDFVNILQDDHRIITVLTDKINHVKWLDQECREINEVCHPHNNCRCIQFDRCLDCRGIHGFIGHQEHCPQCEEHRHEELEHCPHCEEHHHEKLEHCPHCEEHRHKKQKHCPQCGEHRHEKLEHCPHCKENHHNRQEHSNHFHNVRENDCCQPRFTCFCDFAIPFCDDRIELRLAGLTDDLNFQLLQHKGCKVKLELA